MRDDYVTRAIHLALEEDIGTGDVTSTVTVPAGTRASGEFLAKSHGVVSGLDVASRTFRAVDPGVEFAALVGDGDRVSPGERIARVFGEARSLLAAERVALNFLQRLSGVATATARYAEAVAGTGAWVIDTRKTTPGMRLMEKAAVRHGGGRNHRFGLSDGILIKDNHLAAIGGPDRIARAIAAARSGAPHTLRVEVEVTTLDELEQALVAGADAVLLDNMAVDVMAEAVRRTRGRAILEASGGITLETVRRVAETGVDLVSVGALTHSAPSLDISLELALDTGGTDR
ncbi:MAG TPA: carboxylating nicotinate-nucleotide diphosphorylase [Thermomicrobiaceae bacterium]|nr:carboxylating nicotinate-nucleotide diphosphorylase [Thermomicrobiaceae bacterium]